ncbi:hypothetical protein FRC09_016103 [Ceratobasidium sp. 395]|nr:hypothetical protein FRC09_016103 [Ceratobasidium sp. 395]
MKFQSPFERVLPRPSDRRNVSALSPDGQLIASAGSSGEVMLINAQFGNTLGFINFIPLPIVYLRWINKTQLLVGNINGGVFQVALFEKVSDDSNELASISTIIPESKDDFTTTMCYSPRRNMIAIGFIGEIRIWGLRLSEAGQRRWVQLDTIECKDDRGLRDCATAMTFFGHGDQSLCAFTYNQYMIWSSLVKLSKWHTHDWDTGIHNCTVSPDGQSMAVSTTDLSILIWPLGATGPVISGQRKYKMSGGRDWIEYAGMTPLAYLDTETILTTDTVGNMYAISTDGKFKHSFTVGEYFFVRAVLVHGTLINIILMGPTCTTMLMVLTTDATMHDRMQKAYKQLGPRTAHRLIEQNVITTDLAATGDALEGTAEADNQGGFFSYISGLFSTLARCFNWRNLVRTV